MSKSGKLIIAVVVVAVIAMGALLFTRKDKTDKSSSTPGSSSSETHEQDSNAPVAVGITYDGNSFSPSSVTVAAGETVRISNRSESELEFASDPHPTHTDNSEINTGDIEPGGSTTFIPYTKGTWGFHNHYDPGKRGTLTVK